MEKKRLHISILTTLLFVFGLQFLGSQLTLHAAVSSNVTTSVKADSFDVFEEDLNDETVYQSGDYHHIEILSEIGEETPEEEQESTTNSSDIAVSHAFYTSYLRLTTKVFKCQKAFEKSTLLSTTPIYLFFEVFRL